MTTDTVSGTNSATDRNADKIWDHIEKFHDCMLVTYGRNGLHARPMSQIVRRQDQTIWFLTDEHGSKDVELEANKDIALTYSKGSTHIAVTGVAELVDGRATIKDLWNAGAQAFYPQGPEDPSIRAIAVHPTSAELWDGPTKPVALLKMAVANVTGRIAHDMGEHIKTGKLG